MTLPRRKPAHLQSRHRIIVGLPAALLLVCLGAGLPLHCSADATTRADQRFTSYAFAHEFGSGIYDFSGRTLQVYSLPIGWNVVEAHKDQTGLRLRLPVTLGFLDFQPADVVESGLPDRVDSISFVPGIELDFAVAAHWRLLPYVQAGFSTASESDVESSLVGAGVRAEHEFAAGDFAGLFVTAATYSRVSYRGDSLADDDFLRLRNSIEFRHRTGLALGDHPLECGLFATIDVFADPPTGPTTGIDVPRAQFETGVVFGTQPQWRIWRVPLPRVGLSYRFAGDVSAVRFVLGAPF